MLACIHWSICQASDGGIYFHSIKTADNGCWCYSWFRDWYDVEASEQIKAFRCGEFDECIEKANAILHALQLERAQKVEDDIEQEMTSASVPKRSTHLQLDLNRSPDYNEMIISLPDVSGCDRVKTLFEEPAITEPGIHYYNFIWSRSFNRLPWFTMWQIYILVPNR